MSECAAAVAERVEHANAERIALVGGLTDEQPSTCTASEGSPITVVATSSIRQSVQARADR